MTTIWTRWKALARPWKFGIALAALAVAYVLLGFLVLPPVARSLLASNLAEVLRRPVTVQAVRFNPFTLRLEVQGVVVREPGSEDVFVSLDSLVADVGSVSLFRWAVVLDEVRLTRPFVHLVLGRGTSNFQDLVAAGGGTAPQEALETSPGGPFPLVVRDFVIQGGRLSLDDEVRGRSHLVEDINLRVPFTSSLPDDKAVPVQPFFSAVVNGSPLAVKGRILPFDESLRSEFGLSLRGLDLARYWAYAPAPQGLVLESGRLGLDLVLSFERGQGLLPMVSASGNATLEDVALLGPDGPLAGFGSLAVELERFGLLERQVRLGLVRLEEPSAHLGLTSSGALDWAGLLAGFGAKNGAKNGADPPEAPFVVLVRRFELASGSVAFTDRSVAKGFARTVQPLDLAVDGFTTALGGRTVFSLTAGPEGGERVTASGEVDAAALSGHGSLAVSGLVLPGYKAYYAPALPLDLASGSLGLECAWRMDQGGQGLVVEDLALGLRDLVLALPGVQQPALSLPRVDLAAGRLDLDGRRVSVGSLDVRGGLVRLRREQDGGLDLVRALVPAGGERAETAPAGSAPGPAWTVSLGRASLSGLGLELTDLAAPRGAAVLALSDVAASMAWFSTVSDAPLPVTLSARLGQGRFSAEAELRPGPLAARGRVAVDGLGLREFGPWLPADMDLSLSKGRLDAALQVHMDQGREGGDLGLAGNVSLTGLLVRDNAGGADAVSLGRLAVTGARLELEPLEIAAAAVRLEDPVLRLVREPDGRLNLARMLGAPAPAAENATAPNEPAPGARAGESASPAWSLALGETVLTGGRITFLDETVQPAFTADLAGLEVMVGGLTLPGDSTAPLVANATLDGQAALAVSGSLGSAGDETLAHLVLSLDNYAMTRLTPYTLKAIAYPVAAGRLSHKVRLDLEGPALDMDNLFLARGFDVGDKVDNPDAISLPMGLVLALLRDLSGDIELNVPVQGRLDDPQFRLGKVVVRTLLNILAKIVTSPFALIGGLFGGGGGGQDLDVVAFEPGRAQVQDQAAAGLDTVRTALEKRPGLRLEISGRADAALDGPVLTRRKLALAVQSLKFEDLAGRKDAPADADQVVLTPGEYEDYLFQVYKAAPFDKARNALGMVRKQPVETMEAMLLDHLAATPADLDSLARERAEAVREQLLAPGLEPGRVQLGDSASGGEGAGPRADLRLQ